MNCCKDLQEKFEGKSVKDIPDLYKKLEEVTIDYKNWITTFKCKSCGQFWLEAFIEKGHGEVPEVYKKS